MSSTMLLARFEHGQHGYAGSEGGGLCAQESLLLLGIYSLSGWGTLALFGQTCLIIYYMFKLQWRHTLLSSTVLPHPVTWSGTYSAFAAEVESEETAAGLELGASPS